MALRKKVLKFLAFIKGITKTEIPKTLRIPVRLYVDGCFDLMHYGHFNALRQAKSMCDVLVCGVCSTESII